jgi:hypothetical protein
MKKLTIITIIFLFVFYSFSKAQNIYTVAGNGIMGYSGDGGAATLAEIANPMGVAIDNYGNIYIVDVFSIIRKVNKAGIISTIAGIGIAGYSGDGGPATAAELNMPNGVAVDGFGNVYIADTYNNCIRIINTSGIINTFAGDTTNGFSGDGGQATDAELNKPGGLATDIAGNIYIADTYNNRIRKITPSGIISTVAGNGLGCPSSPNDSGPATNAELPNAYGVAVDPLGNMYIATSNRIRKVDNSGVISTIAGNGNFGYTGDGGPATAAEIWGGFGVALDSYGNLFIQDGVNHVVRKVNTSGIISTIAGDGNLGFYGDGGPATNAEFEGITGIASDASGNIYISDQGNNRIREVSTPSLGINDINSVSKVNIYPIPNNGKFTLEMNTQSQGAEIDIFNLTGEEVYVSKIIGTNTLIDLFNPPAGLYIYRIKSETGESVSDGKFIIQ